MKNHPKPTRAHVLPAVTEEILARKDGQIPTNIDGIDTFFHGTEGLADALLLRWHTLLTASLERGLVGDPEDREEMVIEAWRHATDTHRGVRMVIDELLRTRQPTEWRTLSARPRATTGHPWPSQPGWPVASTNQRFEWATASSSKRDGATSLQNTPRHASRDREPC